MTADPRAPSVPVDASVPVPASDHGHSPDRWPLRDAIALGALDGAAPTATERADRW
jgi:hypothetical protein